MFKSPISTVGLARHCELQHLRRCASTRTTRYLNNDLHPLISPRINALPRCQNHPFSTSPPWRAGVAKAIKATARRSTGPSMAVEQEKARKQAMRDGSGMMDDMGLLPGTIVMPSWKNRPSWLKNFRGRLKLERKRWWSRGYEVVR